MKLDILFRLKEITIICHHIKKILLQKKEIQVNMKITPKSIYYQNGI